MLCRRINWRGAVALALFGLLFFCFAGGFSLVKGLTSGFDSLMAYRFGGSALFYVGFVFTGLFGFLYALKWRLDGVRCLLGLGIVVFSYVAVEVLFWSVTGGHY